MSKLEDDEAKGREPPSLNELYIKVLRIDSGRKFWMIIALAAMVFGAIMTCVVVWLAFTLQSRNAGIDRRNCRDEIFAEWADATGDVIDGSVKSDPAAIDKANNELQDVGSLRQRYVTCYKEN